MTMAHRGESPYQLAKSRQALRAEQARLAPAATGVLPPTSGAETAFLTELNGRTILTAPAEAWSGSQASADAVHVPAELAAAWERAAGANPYFTWLQGRFVEAEKANSNGAFWSTADLSFGEVTVKHGPLNWLHESHRIVGTLADGVLVGANEGAAAGGERPHIVAAAVLWKHLFPTQAAVVERASAEHQLYYSMECVSREITCETSSDGTRVGCGKSYPYMQTKQAPETLCSHMREKSAQRHFVDPVFLGGAVIVPPVKPGWKAAEARVVEAAAAEAERTYDHAPAGVKDRDWAALMLSVASYAYSEEP